MLQKYSSTSSIPSKQKSSQGPEEGGPEVEGLDCVSESANTVNNFNIRSNCLRRMLSKKVTKNPATGNSYSLQLAWRTIKFGTCSLSVWPKFPMDFQMLLEFHQDLLLWNLFQFTQKSRRDQKYNTYCRLHVDIGIGSHGLINGNI